MYINASELRLRTVRAVLNVTRDSTLHDEDMFLFQALCILHGNDSKTPFFNLMPSVAPVLMTFMFVLADTSRDVQDNPEGLSLHISHMNQML